MLVLENDWMKAEVRPNKKTHIRWQQYAYVVFAPKCICQRFMILESDPKFIQPMFIAWNTSTVSLKVYKKYGSVWSLSICKLKAPLSHCLAHFRRARFVVIGRWVWTTFTKVKYSFFIISDNECCYFIFSLGCRCGWKERKQTHTLTTHSFKNDYHVRDDPLLRCL
jgi:hypothetical protein